MKSYSGLEKLFASVLSAMPGVKWHVKKAYRAVNYYAYRNNQQYQSVYAVKKAVNNEHETFFGYYDKTPENKLAKFLIYQCASHQTRNKPDPNKPVSITIKDLHNNEEHIVGESLAYNWQQGTKLQWLTNNTFIYNLFDKNKGTYFSRIYDASLKKEAALVDFPVYDCFNDVFALSLNFDRLAQLRPDYGYRNLKTRSSLNDRNKDGLFYINLVENKTQLLFSLEDLIAISHHKSMADAKHKVNHIMISPDGQRFIFLHRWFAKNGKRVDRLLLADTNGKTIKVLADEGMVSHCCWLDNNTLIAYMRHQSHGNAFYKICTNTSKVELLSEKIQHLGDGHPSVYNNKMLFDSYPDRAGMKHLFLFDLENEELEHLGSFLEPLRFCGETRCDLHPRWGSKGSRIYFDSVHEGKRGLYYLSLES